MEAENEREENQMFTSRMITLTPAQQQIARYMAEKEMEKARKNLAFVQNRYDHWDQITDKRILNRYTKEEYRENFIEHWELEIKRWEDKLERIKQGYDFE